MSHQIEDRIIIRIRNKIIGISAHDIGDKCGIKNHQEIGYLGLTVLCYKVLTRFFRLSYLRLN